MEIIILILLVINFINLKCHQKAQGWLLGQGFSSIATTLSSWKTNRSIAYATVIPVS